MERRRFLATLAGAAMFAARRRSRAGEETPAVVPVPAGPYLAGSTRAERDYAYALDARAYGHDVTRRQGWYEHESALHRVELAGFAIMRDPVTNAEYARFVAATGHRAPRVSPAEWARYGLRHPYERTLRHQWRQGMPPAGRESHPVVLVAHGDAEAYAAWLSEQSGRRWRLPTEEEWEKAARGTDGRYFPWGNRFDPTRLNSADRGPFDTVPVGTYPEGASPFGMRDAAGQVFEWTATAAGAGRYIVKGGSWDDRGCGVCRPAARHSRPAALKHILIGFRLVTALEE